MSHARERIPDRLSSEAAFGLVELLIAMMVLVIGIMAIVAGFSSGAAALVRANRVGTAAAVADTRLELYRAIGYSEIALDSGLENAAAATTPYNAETGIFISDSAPNAADKLDDATCPDKEWCEPSRDTTGPDGRLYRVDTYIALDNPAGGRQVKQVTVVVRDVSDGLRVLNRQISTFDKLSR
ncbi:MAG: type II secretion system protein [Actinobacteria bacterium]|nr:type II secretion system protein [Actinomycetota bacterium]